MSKKVIRVVKVNKTKKQLLTAKQRNEKGKSGEKRVNLILERNAIWPKRNYKSIGIEDINAIYKGRHIIIQVKNTVQGFKSISAADMNRLIDKGRLTNSITWYAYNNNRKWHIYDPILALHIPIVTEITRVWENERKKITDKIRQLAKEKKHGEGHDLWLKWMSRQVCSIDLEEFYSFPPVGKDGVKVNGVPIPLFDSQPYRD